MNTLLQQYINPSSSKQGLGHCEPFKG